MELELTSEAAEWIRRKGGTVAIDHISAVGCGKQPEVAIDTYLKGKDVSRYLIAERDGVRVLISPAMATAAPRLQVGTKGAAFWRSLQVTAELDHQHGPACSR